MMTGEGKTLMATLALALNALSGQPCYLVTVNDYLARRDADLDVSIYEYLGLSVGAIQSSLDPSARKPIYTSDIVYATNNELGFDYLRDNMKTSLGQQVQKDLYFAIVDEVDSILIDEARTPLIISGPAEDHVGRYAEADRVARQLVRDDHYEVKEKERIASLTEDGIVKAQEILGGVFLRPRFRGLAPTSRTRCGLLALRTRQGVRRRGGREIPGPVICARRSSSSTSSPGARWRADAGRTASTRPSR